MMQHARAHARLCCDRKQLQAHRLQLGFKNPITATGSNGFCILIKPFNIRYQNSSDNFRVSILPSTEYQRTDNFFLLYAGGRFSSGIFCHENRKYLSGRCVTKFCSYFLDRVCFVSARSYSTENTRFLKNRFL